MKTLVKIQKGCVLGGAMAAEKATGNSLITFGAFTQEAKNFFERKPIQMIAGNQLKNIRESPQTKMTPKWFYLTRRRQRQCSNKEKMRLSSFF